MKSIIKFLDRLIFRVNLVKYRKLAGLTQNQLANKVHVMPCRIANYELGKSIPHFRVVHRLTEALGVSYDDLTSNEEIENILYLFNNHVPDFGLIQKAIYELAIKLEDVECDQLLEEWKKMTVFINREFKFTRRDPRPEIIVI